MDCDLQTLFKNPELIQLPTCPNSGPKFESSAVLGFRKFSKSRNNS